MKGLYRWRFLIEDVQVPGYLGTRKNLYSGTYPCSGDCAELHSTGGATRRCEEEGRILHLVSWDGNYYNGLYGDYYKDPFLHS